MKKTISILLILIMTLFLFTACKKDENVPSGMQLASGDAATYSLFVPSDWKIDVQTGYTAAHAEDKDSNTNTNVSVTTYELQYTNSTVDEWWEINKADLADFCTDYKEISIGTDTVLDGVNAKEYVYTAKLGPTSFTFHQVAAVADGGVVYIITYTCTTDRYESYFETFNKITGEFKF